MLPPGMEHVWGEALLLARKMRLALNPKERPPAWKLLEEVAGLAWEVCELELLSGSSWSRDQTARARTILSRLADLHRPAKEALAELEKVRHPLYPSNDRPGYQPQGGPEGPLPVPPTGGSGIRPPLYLFNMGGPAGTFGCAYCGKQVATEEHIHHCATLHEPSVYTAQELDTRTTQAKAEGYRHGWDAACSEFGVSPSFLFDPPQRTP